MNYFRFIAVLFLLVLAQLRVSAVTLEQIISREHPHFDNAKAVMQVGRDGNVYLGSSGNNSHVIRTTREGQSKYGGDVVYALTNATANKDGIVATANGHFAHKVVLYDKNFKQIAEVADFLVSDQVGWDAPSHVEAGESGDFYGMDQHRNRILRISGDASNPGKVLRSYSIPREPAAHPGLVQYFRVSEKDETFYTLNRQNILRAVGFDGKTKWEATIPGLTYLHGGFDLAPDGTIYAIGGREDTIKKISAADGKVMGEIKLAMGELKPANTGPAIRQLQVFDNEILIKRDHPTGMFQRYALNSGERLAVVTNDHERLTVSYPDEVWTAGAAVPFSIDFNTGGRTAKPNWRVWLRPLNYVNYQELPLREGKVLLPANLGGIYQIKVTPEAQPLEYGDASEYLVRSWIEVRAPGSKGSVSVLTPDNRVYYGRGEQIPLSVLVRSQETAPVQVDVQLRESQNDRTIAQSTASVTPGKVLQMDLSPTFTRALRMGEYQLVASAPNLTPVAHQLVIGPGSSEISYMRMMHGDYGQTYPSATLFNTPDVVAAHTARMQRMGFNIFVDRIGSPLQLSALRWGNEGQKELKELVKRLQSDPTAAAPETLQFVSPLMQVMAAYSAYDMKQMAILFMMDAGLPLGGPGFDNRKPEQLEKDIKTVTDALLPYPSFRGWSWHANWWIYNQRGSAAAETPEERAAYEAALKEAEKTGKWSPVLEKVSRRRLGFAVEAQEFMKNALHKVAPDERLKIASAGTYRNVESYPPISFQNVEEVDLQGQFEQIFTPYFPAHSVDFYRRPGKPVWGHPEVWNESGTGGQVLPELFSMMMRAPDGVGVSGNLPRWRKGVLNDDPRISDFGIISVHRALNNVLRRYGPWLSTLETEDKIAIVGSSRQFMVDQWARVMGRHFARVMEAYVSCLHAHHPASIVFVEDMKPDTLAKYKAVLVVDQWIEMEPMLQTALQNAQKEGTKVLYDGTSREELLKGYTPLGISFNKFEEDKHPATDDGAYYRFPKYVMQHVPALKKTLDAITPPVARVDNPEVWVSQQISESGKYLFVVNNSSMPLEPSQMWRTNLFISSTLPVVEQVGFTTPTPAVYDVFAMKQVTPQNGTVTADLRDLPARIYAVLPAPIGSVALRGPNQVAAGQPLQWWAQVRDAGGKPIAASVPLRARLLAADGSTLDEQISAAPSKGAYGELVIPINAPAGAAMLEVTELLSGKSARLSVASSATKMPLPLREGVGEGASRVANANTSGETASLPISPSESEFGPHLRDVIITNGGKTAVMNAMNWDDNLYGVDTDTGRVLWRGKVGNYYAFAPQNFNGGFAVQGFDYNTAEGYHLYTLSDSGQPQRRFALYGLPRRLPHRFVPGLLGDRENPINNFVTPIGGNWFASAGDLGLAVWDKSGKLLWKQDWLANRRIPRLAALGNDALLVGEGMKVVAYNAQNGKEIWKQELAPTGAIREIATSGDGKTTAVLSSSEGGRIYILRNGQRVRTLISDGDDIEISADGSRYVVVDENQLRYYTLEGDLQWSFSGDEWLHSPRLMPDGSRVVASSELGTVYVLDAGGRVLLQHDNEAMTAPAWLPGGDLLLANWMGKVTRLDGSLKPKWSTLVQPGAATNQKLRESLTAKTNLPTAQIGGWSNAAAQSLPLTPNLLTETKAIVSFVAEGANHIRFVRDPAALTDGDAAAPAEPWLDWGDINWFAEAKPPTSIVLDAFRTQMRVNAITFVEDAARPDSWLRDAHLEYWNPATEQWVYVQPLLSDSAIHTHTLTKPVDAARLRVKIPNGFYSNLRLGEIVLHGEKLGASHPDVVAKRPQAVLFDENDEVKTIFPYADRWSVQLTGAHSGGRFIQVNANQTIAPAYRPPFGHAMPNWDMEIAEDPQPGQYRYLQFAWKALSPEVKGASLLLSGEGGATVLHAGEKSPNLNGEAHQVGNTVPQEWQTVRVDLWELFKKPARIQTMYLGAAGGPVGFDQVVLARTPDALPPEKK